MFTTGVKEITTEPAFYNNVVEFNGSYYKAEAFEVYQQTAKAEER